MAIAFDNAADGGDNGGSSTSLTFSYTASGTDPYLLVAILGDVVSGGSDDLTSVTFNSVTMTQLVKYGSTVSGSERWMYLMGLAGQTGTANVVATFGSTHYILCGAASYSGVGQTGQPDNTTTNSGAGPVSTLTTSLTTVADNCWTMLMEQGFENFHAPTAGTGSTRRAYGVSFGNWGLFDSNADITPGGSSYSMTTGYPIETSVATIQHIMISLAPVGGGGARLSRLTLLGAG